MSTQLILFSLFSSTLSTNTEVTSVVTSLSQSHEGGVLLHFGSDSHEFELGSSLFNGHENTGGLSGSSDFFSLSALAEDDQLALVGVQSVDVGLETFDLEMRWEFGKVQGNPSGIPVESQWNPSGIQWIHHRIKNANEKRKNIQTCSLFCNRQQYQWFRLLWH